MTPPRSSLRVLPGHWPSTVVCLIGATIGDCDKCCTAETDGDLCARCHEVYDAIAFVLAAPAEAERELLRAARDLIGTLGPNGYFPTAGKPKTDALRAAIAKADVW